MKTSTTTVPGASAGIELSTLCVAPQSPKAVLQLVHGMAEHKERYIPFMNYMAEKGYACVICDLRGHGASVKDPKDLGWMGKGGVKAMVDDVYCVTGWAKTEFPGLPFFLFGHSMGSMIVRSYLKRYGQDIDGLIVCGSPSQNPAAGIGSFLAGCISVFRGPRYRSQFLANLCTGANDRKFKADGIKNAWLSTNKANVEAYNADPLCGFVFTANGYRTGLFRLMQDIYSPKGWNVVKPDLPIHFIAGAQDPCIINLKKFSKAVSFLRNCGYREVTSKVYPMMRHEILNENGREEVWSDVRALLDGWLAR